MSFRLTFLAVALGAALTTHGHVHASDADINRLAKQATAAYAAKDYVASADGFAAAIAAGGDEPALFYNAACAYALAGRPEAAFDFLRQATVAGYTNVTAIHADADLVSLHADPRFEATAGRGRPHAAAPHADVEQHRFRDAVPAGPRRGPAHRRSLAVVVGGQVQLRQLRPRAGLRLGCALHPHAAAGACSDEHRGVLPSAASVRRAIARWAIPASPCRPRSPINSMRSPVTHGARRGSRVRARTARPSTSRHGHRCWHGDRFDRRTTGADLGTGAGCPVPAGIDATGSRSAHVRARPPVRFARQAGAGPPPRRRRARERCRLAAHAVQGFRRRVLRRTYVRDEDAAGQYRLCAHPAFRRSQRRRCVRKPLQRNRHGRRTCHRCARQQRRQQRRGLSPAVDPDRQAIPYITLADPRIPTGLPRLVAPGRRACRRRG